MAKNKKIPCRVCGKLFTPCSSCEKKTDIFRWRNFACSKECAEKYFKDTITFRNKNDKILKSENSNFEVAEKNSPNEPVDEIELITTRKKMKKASCESKEDKEPD